MNIKTFFLFLIFFIAVNGCSYCQSDSIRTAYSLSCDTVNKNKFKKLVKAKLVEMKVKEHFSLSELIQIIKIGMSPALGEKTSKRTKKIYREFHTFYWEKIIEIVSNDKAFSYAPLRGMVGYSLKFNMYITPPLKPSEMPCHNYYFVKDN